MNNYSLIISIWRPYASRKKQISFILIDTLNGQKVNLFFCDSFG